MTTPTPPPPPIWTLPASLITGGSAGVKLAGCHITTDAAGTAYEFTEPNITKVLSTTTGSSLPSVPFTFPTFSYKGLDWNITVTSLSVGVNGHGTWSTPGNETLPTGPENGDYTAQAGAGFEEDDAAHSAKAC
jgi:hypothetical protein